MKLAKISLSAAALVVSIVGAFAFRSHAARFVPGTLYTALGTQHVNCSAGLSGRPACNVNAFTVNGSPVSNAKETTE